MQLKSRSTTRRGHDRSGGRSSDLRSRRGQQAAEGLRALRQRLQRLREQPPGGRAVDDERHRLRRQAPSASGEHGRERSHAMRSGSHGEPGRWTDRCGANPWASASWPARHQSRRAVGSPQTRPGRPHRGRRIAPQALARLETRVRPLTRRTKGVSLEQTIEGLRIDLIGWLGYVTFCQTLSVQPAQAGLRGGPGVLRELHQWLRRRLRAINDQEAIEPIREANRVRWPWRRLDAMAQRVEPGPAIVQTGRAASARDTKCGQPARSPPRAAAGRVSSRDRMKGLLPLNGRIAASPALNMALSNAVLASLGFPPMTPRAA
jgi:hypothetical protein